jgi:hypothetical protein
MLKAKAVIATGGNPTFFTQDASMPPPALTNNAEIAYFISFVRHTAEGAASYSSKPSAPTPNPDDPGGGTCYTCTRPSTHTPFTPPTPTPASPVRPQSPRFRKPLLYPLSYEGIKSSVPSFLRGSNKTVGDCPDFAESSEQNGTGTARRVVPFSETVLLESLSSKSSH